VITESGVSEALSVLDRLTIRHDRRRGAYVLRLGGTLDFFSAPKLKLALADLVRTGASDVVLDLSALRSLDAVGLAVVLCQARHLAHAGGRLLLVDPPPDVREVLEGTRAAQHLAVVMGSAEHAPPPAAA
jgi:anti-anti-sigma factor